MKKVYIIAILVMCCLPLLLMPVLGEKESAEKRALSAFPSLFEDGKFNTSFSQQLDTWITEHFSLRSEMITANNYLKATVFSSSDEDKVIVGKDDWLYFAETAPDFLGQNLLADREITDIAYTLELVNEYVTDKGGRLVFAAAPNKNTLYPGNMPAYYRRTSEKTNLDRLTEALSEKPYFIDLRKTLSTAEEQTYHARDSHWNNIGARYGFNALLDTAGKRHERYEDRTYHWERVWDGDLDGMIFPKLGYKDWQAVFDIDWTYAYTSNFHSEEDVLITTENQDAEGTLLMFRDSFTNALLPFMAQNYASATFSRATPYSLYQLEETAYDTVIIEIVERNLPNLLLTAPMMPALRREAAEGNETRTEAVLHTRDVNGYRHVYGFFAQGEEERPQHIYLQFAKEGDVWLAEAFPIYEAALLKEGGTGRQGFSAYIPAESCEGYSICVLTE